MIRGWSVDVDAMHLAMLGSALSISLSSVDLIVFQIYVCSQCREDCSQYKLSAHCIPEKSWIAALQKMANVIVSHDN